ncbi:hypothetical protein [Thaumasiovibrio subtropicus]|uniref:hypothetical protein n=1 Tax=Thaumasiovibrio subtropicus TaxID=1891207 RepID=UPI001C8477BC|nr:hypothetical protein [Thaumasiovibrio subtropicus]
MKRMNAIYCCCISNVWIKTAEYLVNECNIEPKYFVGWKGDLPLNKHSDVLRNCFTQYVEDAWRGIGFPSYVDSTIECLDEPVIASYSHEISVGIKMIDRLDPTGEMFPFTERYFWFLGLVEKWLRVIETEDIEVVISPSIPHRVFDYALYIAARIKSVRFVMFQMTPFSDKSFIIDDVNSTCSYMKEAISSNQFTEKTLDSDIQNRLNLLLSSYEDAVPDYMIKQKKESKISNRISSKISKLKNCPLFLALLILTVLLKKANQAMVKCQS